MNELVRTEQVSSPSLVPANMAEAVQLANFMASSKLVPAALQKSPGDCLMVVMQAVRWGMDPFAVAQECSVIQNKLMHSGKLVAAVINTRGGLTQRMSFEYDGEGDKRTVVVSGQLRSEPEPRTVNVTFKEARTQNKVWQTQPDQQLAYHGARVWARRHMPELMLGVWAKEEFDGKADNDDDDAAPVKERRKPIAAPLKMAKLAEVAPPKPDFVHFAPGSSLAYDRETGEVTDTNEPVREDDAPAAPPESPSAPSGLAYAEGHLSDEEKSAPPPSAAEYVARWEAIADRADTIEMGEQMIMQWNKEKTLRNLILWPHDDIFPALQNKVREAAKVLKERVP